MIFNEEEAKEKITEYSDKGEIFKTLLKILRNSEEKYKIHPKATGFEISIDNQVKGKPNRGIIKFFFHKDKVVGFFYKKSLIPHSRDRFSYGGMEVKPEFSDENQIKSWLKFLVSGFSPSYRPEKFRRSFPFDIPE
ncbi:MAG: hypothetical protein AB1410_04360 [Acidobacteriota bacterium]